MDDMKKLKAKYGEAFAKFCWRNFPTIFESGEMYDLIHENFAESKFLIEDIMSSEQFQRDFVIYVQGQWEVRQNKQENPVETILQDNPFNLMKKAGYTLYECKTHEDVMEFLKYYDDGDELCTFSDPNRIVNCRIFFAVKDNLESIKKNTEHPRRQDPYGTSVISLQFTRGANSKLSIKNRYNHNIENPEIEHPDATFSNNLENIYPGLTDSFKVYCEIEFLKDGVIVELPHYTMGIDGKFYRYNDEINDTYFCENNFILCGGVPQQIDKARFELIDSYILDKQYKKLKLGSRYAAESLPDVISDIKTIDLDNDKDSKQKLYTITTNDGKIFRLLINKHNQLIGLETFGVDVLPDNFARRASHLEGFKSLDVTKIEGNCFALSKNLKDFCVPNLTQMGTRSCPYFNGTRLFLPNLQSMQGGCFEHCTQKMSKIDCEKLSNIGSMNFLNCNADLVYMPNLVKMGNKAFAGTIWRDVLEKQIEQNQLQSNETVETRVV